MSRALGLAISLLVVGCASRSLEVGETAVAPNAKIDAGVNAVDLAVPIDLAIPCAVANDDFANDIWPMLLNECGACHSTVSGAAGPGFLSSPDAFLAYLAGDPNLEGFFGSPHVGSRVSPALSAALQNWLHEYQTACRP